MMCHFVSLARVKFVILWPSQQLLGALLTMACGLATTLFALYLELRACSC
jgi:hypothetical protein